MRWARSGAVAVVRTTFPGSSAARLVERCAHLCGGAARARGQPLGDEHAALEELCQWVGRVAPLLQVRHRLLPDADRRGAWSQVLLPPVTAVLDALQARDGDLAVASRALFVLAETAGLDEPGARSVSDKEVRNSAGAERAQWILAAETEFNESFKAMGAVTVAAGWG